MQINRATIVSFKLFLKSILYAVWISCEDSAAAEQSVTHCCHLPCATYFNFSLNVFKRRLKTFPYSVNDKTKSCSAALLSILVPLKRLYYLLTYLKVDNETWKVLFRSARSGASVQVYASVHPVGAVRDLGVDSIESSWMLSWRMTSPVHNINTTPPWASLFTQRYRWESSFVHLFWLTAAFNPSW